MSKEYPPLTPEQWRIFEPRSFEFLPDIVAPLALRMTGLHGQHVTLRLRKETCEGLGSLLLSYAHHLSAAL